ncbi:MAG TPA: CAP domain-containing protein [Leptolyngbyaceae cyanobacterium M65_K2018_010]|nr:CAP domain-containing protein [Leptolyngbyaceae cyanobacterium M65_K2018_010]
MTLLLLGSTALAALSQEPRSLGQPRFELAQTSDRTLQTLLNLVNVERQRAGLAPLVLSPQLTTAAQRHAQDMANTRRLSHTGSDGSTLRSRIDATGYRWTSIGENVAMGQSTPEAVMASWMASPGHRQNILNPNFTQLGLGYALGGGRPYWVQVFAKPR